MFKRIESPAQLAEELEKHIQLKRAVRDRIREEASEKTEFAALLAENYKPLTSVLDEQTKLAHQALDDQTKLARQVFAGQRDIQDTLGFQLQLQRYQLLQHLQRRFDVKSLLAFVKDGPVRKSDYQTIRRVGPKDELGIGHRHVKYQRRSRTLDIDGLPQYGPISDALMTYLLTEKDDPERPNIENALSVQDMQLYLQIVDDLMRASGQTGTKPQKYVSVQALLNNRLGSTSSSPPQSPPQSPPPSPSPSPSPPSSPRQHGTGLKLGNWEIDTDSIQTGRLLVRDNQGKVVMDIKPDLTFWKLLQERFNPKFAYTQKAIEQFRKLIRGSGAPISKNSAKYKLVYPEQGGCLGKPIYYNNPEVLVERLNVLIGSILAGNRNNPNLINEASAILDELLKLKLISEKTAKSIFKKYLSP